LLKKDKKIGCVAEGFVTIMGNPVNIGAKVLESFVMGTNVRP
jgi:hypothetical protein